MPCRRLCPCLRAGKPSRARQARGAHEPRYARASHDTRVRTLGRRRRVRRSAQQPAATSDAYSPRTHGAAGKRRGARGERSGACHVVALRHAKRRSERLHRKSMYAARLLDFVPHTDSESRAVVSPGPGTVWSTQNRLQRPTGVPKSPVRGLGISGARASCARRSITARLQVQFTIASSVGRWTAVRRWRTMSRARAGW